METILVVDDEPVVTGLIRTVLELASHSVMTVRIADAFLTAARMPFIELLIIESRMREDRGREIAEGLLREHPAMKVLHLSGLPRERLEREGRLLPASDFLYKPFTAQQIRDAVLNVLASSADKPCSKSDQET